MASLRGSVIKNELEFVQQRPLDRFRATLVSEPLHGVQTGLHFARCWWSLQCREKEMLDDRSSIRRVSKDPLHARPVVGCMDAVRDESVVHQTQCLKHRTASVARSLIAVS